MSYKLEDLEKTEGEVLSCEQVARVLQTKSRTVSKWAKERPEQLGFPVIVMGDRVKVPKAAFLRFMRGAG